MEEVSLEKNFKLPFGPPPAPHKLHISRLSRLLRAYQPLPPQPEIGMVDLNEIEAQAFADAHDAEFDPDEVAAINDTVKEVGEDEPEEPFISKMPAVNPAHAEADALFDQFIELDVEEEEAETPPKNSFSIKGLFRGVKEAAKSRIESFNPRRTRRAIAALAVSMAVLMPSASANTEMVRPSQSAQELISAPQAETASIADNLGKILPAARTAENMPIVSAEERAAQQRKVADTIRLASLVDQGYSEAEIIEILDFAVYMEAQSQYTLGA